jgi:DoxX-like family
MVLALWIVQVLLASTFSNAASRKLVRKEGKASKGMAWREDFSQGTVRLVGVLELLGAAGLVLPALTGVLPWLTPLAAAGLPRYC